MYQRRAAADHRDPLAGLREHRGVHSAASPAPAPDGGLASRSRARLRSFLRDYMPDIAAEIQHARARQVALSRLRACGKPTGWAAILERSVGRRQRRRRRARRRARRLCRRRSGATCGCSRSSACSPAPTAAPWPRACCTSCRCATAAARHGEEKRRIAREAATRVTEGMAIGLTGGTTTTEVARALVDRAAADGRHQRAEHRLRARRAPQPQARRHGRASPAPSPTSWSARSPRRPRGAQPRPRVPRRRRHLGAGRADHPSRGRGAHQPRPDRPRVGRDVVADSSKIGKVAFARICELTASTS